MIIDLAARPVSELPVFDVCIAGAGVAGLTVALQLTERGRRVLLLEAGGRDVSPASQEFYRGENAGIENLPLDRTRLRLLGGSSNHWGGWCRPLDPYDLSRSDLTPGNGWPITANDLDPYLKKAAAVLGVNAASGADRTLSGGDDRLQAIRMYFSRPPARLGDRFHDALEAAPNLLVLLNAAADQPGFDDSLRRLDGLTVRQPGSAPAVHCRARFFVLALGAVENSRMLLLWNRDHGDRIANAAMLGRFYMQHLHQELGQFVRLDGPASAGAAPAGEPENVFLASTESLLRRSPGLGAFRLYSTAIACAGLADELAGVAPAVSCSSVGAGGRLFITCEQSPNAASRISLASTTDAFGRPRARLDWEIGDSDAATLRTAAMEFGTYLIAAGLGRLKVNPAVLDGRTPLAGWTALPSAPGAAGHQMGGLRMSASPDDGVTDPDCRLWNVENVHVAGSAVFRTCGHANPTLTLTQLALRLADRLHARLAAP
jgi:choline dehydrogenase-like flavoprotein